MAEYDIGVCIFCLNESKFLPYSIRGFMASPAVKTIVVVEGHVQGYPLDDVSEDGLSTDGTAEIVRNLMGNRGGGKIVFEQVGFVQDKKDLQNHGFGIIRSILGEDAIHLVAGADEVYHPQELVTLREEFRKRPRAKIIRYPFFHFWWRPDLIAIGSSWNVKMHRAYRRPGLPMIFIHHAAPPADCGKGPQFEVDFIHCYHYVGMQDASHIHAKLKLYKTRDGHRLRVTDTWTDWQWGQTTQWTHTGGSAKRFEGQHPYVIEKDVWKLTPRGVDGGLLPVPEVPWDSDDDTETAMPPKKIGIFVEGGKIPADRQIIDLVSYLVERHSLEVYTIDGRLEDAQQYGIKTVKKFNVAELNRCEFALVLPESFIFRPLGAPHIAILWKQLRVTPDWNGYVVYETEASDIGEFRKLPPPKMFVQDCLSQPTVRVSREAVEVIAKKQAGLPPRTDETISESVFRPRPKPGPLIGAYHTVQIRNVTSDMWKKGVYLVGAFWCDGVRGLPVRQSVQTKRELPKDIAPGEVLEVKVAIPRPPIQTGNLQLRVDLLDNSKGRWLNVGVQIPYTLRSGYAY